MTPNEKQLAQKIMRLKRDQLNAVQQSLRDANRSLDQAKAAKDRALEDWKKAECTYAGFECGSLTIDDLMDI